MRKAIIMAAAVFAAAPAQAEQTVWLDCKNGVNPVLPNQITIDGEVIVDFDRRIVQAPVMGEVEIVETTAKTVNFGNPNWRGSILRLNGLFYATAPGTDAVVNLVCEPRHRSF